MLGLCPPRLTGRSEESAKCNGGKLRVLGRTQRCDDAQPLKRRASFCLSLSGCGVNFPCMLPAGGSKARDGFERRENDRERRLRAPLPEPFVVFRALDGSGQLFDGSASAFRFRSARTDRSSGSPSFKARHAARTSASSGGSAAE